MKFIACLIVLFHLVACRASGQPTDVPASMAVFMAPECPICQYYTPLLKHYTSFKAFKQSDFILAFTTGDSLSALSFENKYQTGWKIIWGDEAKRLAKLYKAGVTPELIILNRKQQLLYKGRLNDAYAAPGRKRPTVRTSEIDTFFQAYRNQTPKLMVPKPAIGCIMNP